MIDGEKERLTKSGGIEPERDRGLGDKGVMIFNITLFLAELSFADESDVEAE
jgi:hypothetical protein